MDRSKIMKYNEFVFENEKIDYVFFINIIRKIAKEKGYQTDGDYIVLYHGTSVPNMKKIINSGRLNSGSWLAGDYETAERYAMMASKGKHHVEIMRVYMGSLYYNGYFSTLCDLYYSEGAYKPKELIYKK